MWSAVVQKPIRAVLSESFLLIVCMIKRLWWFMILSAACWFEMKHIFELASGNLFSLVLYDGFSLLENDVGWISVPKYLKMTAVTNQNTIAGDSVFSFWWDIQHRFWWYFAFADYNLHQYCTRWHDDRDQSVHSVYPELSCVLKQIVRVQLNETERRCSFIVFRHKKKKNMPQDAKINQRHDATAKGAVHIEHILFENVRCRVV